MIDTEWRSACGGHDFDVSVQDTIESLSSLHRKGEAAGICTSSGSEDPFDVKVWGDTKLESWGT